MCVHVLRQQLAPANSTTNPPPWQVLRHGHVKDVRLDVHTGDALITFSDVADANKIVGAPSSHVSFKTRTNTT